VKVIDLVKYISFSYNQPCVNLGIKTRTPDRIRIVNIKKYPKEIQAAIKAKGFSIVHEKKAARSVDLTVVISEQYYAFNIDIILFTIEEEQSLEDLSEFLHNAFELKKMKKPRKK